MRNLPGITRITIFSNPFHDISMKKINIRIIPNARKTAIIEEEGRIKVYVTAPAVDGKANAALLILLAEYLEVRKSDIEILRGEKSRNKLIGIKEN
jgi:uncharacterized protein